VLPDLTVRKRGATGIKGGVLVKMWQRRSQNAGIQPGDVILRISNEVIRDVAL